MQKITPFLWFDDQAKVWQLLQLTSPDTGVTTSSEAINRAR